MALTEFLKGIADAIREKKGTTDPINARNFASEIAAISSSGVEHTNGTQTVSYGYHTVKIAHGLSKAPKIVQCFISDYASAPDNNGCGFVYCDGIGVSFRNTNSNFNGFNVVGAAVNGTLIGGENSAHTKGRVYVDNIYIYCEELNTQWRAGDYVWEAYTW